MIFLIIYGLFSGIVLGATAYFVVKVLLGKPHD